MLIHMIVIALRDLDAGVINMTKVLGISRTPRFEDFVIFLQTMEIYGCGYADDVDYMKFNNRSA